MFQKAELEAPLARGASPVCGGDAKELEKSQTSQQKHGKDSVYLRFLQFGFMESTPACTPDCCPPASPLLNRDPPQPSRSLAARCFALFQRSHAVDEPYHCKTEKRNVVGNACLLCLGAILGALGATAALRWSSPAPYANPSAPRWSSPGLYTNPPVPKEVPKAYLQAQPLNNSCLLQNLEFLVHSDKPKKFDACGFVVRATDETWNLRGNVDEAIKKYFHEGYINAGSWGRRGIGKKELREGVLKEMNAFPDIKIHITDCACVGNDINGYKCSMSDVLEGTNTGDSVYGPATGRYARWNGMIQSIVKQSPTTGQWQFYAEWGVHDEWALIQQLGLDFDRVPRATKNYEPIHDCWPLARFTPEPVYDNYDIEAQYRHYLRSQRTN